MASRTHKPAEADKAAAETGAAGPVAEAVRSEDGTTLHVEGIGAAAVALGQALAVGDGGPGAGEVQVAEAVEGAAIRTTHVDEAVEGLRTDSRRRIDEGLHTRAIEATTVRTVAVVARRVGRDDVLPLSGSTVDPASVPGRKTATAAAQLRRDGRTYVAGEPLPIDFRAHSELVPIGAIVATPWDDLPDHKGD